LTIAAYEGKLDMVRYLVKHDADANKSCENGITALIATAKQGDLDIMRFPVEDGASIGVTDNFRDIKIALQQSCCFGNYSTAQLFMEHAGANIESVIQGGVNNGKAAWELLIDRLVCFEAATFVEGMYEDEDAEALTALLSVMVLRGAPPPIQRQSFSPALLSPEDVRVVQEGARLRTYTLQQRVLLDAHCPLLLPPLRAIVHSCIELTATEDTRAACLGAAPWTEVSIFVTREHAWLLDVLI
jgi:hypothetical protein